MTRELCACGCGELANWDKEYIAYHQNNGKKVDFSTGHAKYRR